MKINVTFEVKSREELVEILQTGARNSLLNYKISDFKILDRKCCKHIKNCENGGIYNFCKTGKWNCYG